LVAFPDTLSMFGNRRTIDRTLRRIMKTGKDKFLPIVTGHQGESGAILTRIVMGDTPYKLEKGDKILFSAKVIPNPMNHGQRYLVEARAKMAGVRIFDDLHVSGHAYKEDHYEFLHLLNPQHVIPSHGDIGMTGEYAKFAEEIGYTLDNDLHVMRNGKSILIK
ncbi:MAG: ribonuclease J, partial [Methanomicrobiales archaeon]|nr:ribonuclease J [Methanomicrobiales archaeon]